MLKRSRFQPILTEKTLKLAKTQNQYTFSVGTRETKYSVRQALKEAFNVNPVDIQIANIQGKAKKRGAKKSLVWGSDLKKAVVKLPEKEKIDLFETEEKNKKSKVKGKK
ncbi:MAG: 50S ribosomal protein L23 [Patescibacteria group bacterium]